MTRDWPVALRVRAAQTETRKGPGLDGLCVHSKIVLHLHVVLVATLNEKVVARNLQEYTSLSVQLLRPCPFKLIRCHSIKVTAIKI